ncbi:MAG: outer membrane protein assembly factor BamC [Methylococcales bacterium]|nr:outer membrane protein assembly factor BamC [Methylococcales bacterium]
MHKKVNTCLICFLLAACSSVPDKYRDLKHLEIPPTLAIEHSSNFQANAGRTEERIGKAAGLAEETSELEKLVMLVGTDAKPRLLIKAGFDRTWDLVERALDLAEIEVLDKSHDDGTLQVHYVANRQGGGGPRSIFSFFGNPSDTEYAIKVDKDQKTTEVHVKKRVTAEQEQANAVDTVNSDDSASLIKLLHKTIIADLEK